jgi:hypothetical protein
MNAARIGSSFKEFKVQSPTYNISGFHLRKSWIFTMHHLMATIRYESRRLARGVQIQHQQEQN